MNIDSYPEKTALLIRQVLDEQREDDTSIFRTLRKLKSIAQKTDDQILLGFMYYQLADAYVSVEVDYGKFRDCLGKAIELLQGAADPELLTRAYNLVGIDASNNGSFDVAYYYFMMAMRTCEDTDNDYLKGILNANIGQIYARLQDPKAARKYLRLSNRQLEKGDRKDVYYYHNLINGQYNEAVLCLEQKDRASAEKKEQKIARLEKLSGGTGLGSTRIPVALLRTQLALCRDDRKVYQQYIRETMEMLASAHQLFDYIEELAQFCRFLLSHNETWPVREVLDMIGPKVESFGIVQIMRTVSSIEVSYYEAVGDKEQLKKHMRRRHMLAARQQEEKQRIYLYSIHLIGIMDEMRREQAMLKAENETLQEQVQTDVLTGIPNRFMMNKLLDEAFEYAYRNRTPFCLEMLDIDHFKEYNDTYGHQAGDECLKRVAAEISRIALLHRKIRCARYGGDEFVLIYENMEDREILEVARELEKRIHALNIPHEGAGKNRRVSVSQGMCNAVPGPKNKLYDFLSEADNALYAVKKNLERGDRKETIRLLHLPESFGTS